MAKKVMVKKVPNKSLEDLPEGHHLFVECPLPDGAVSGHIGQLAGISPGEIWLEDAAFVGHTGRRYKFLAGELDEHAEIEPLPDRSIIRLPRWGALVTDWPFEIPRAPNK
ncbi:hypothetical protein KJ966_31815 [bacterium]|nr:hypothetical protein [bacterium]